MICLIITLIGCSKDDSSVPSEATIPIAGFNYEIKNTTLPRIVDFANSSSNSTSYLWDFDDGNTSTEKNPSHSFVKDGVYKVSLMAVNNDGNDIFTKSITVSTSLASIVSGSYSGNGEFMPGNTKVGDYHSCAIPSDWNKYLKSGDAKCIVSIVNDNTVNISLSGSIYSSSFNRNYDLQSSSQNVISTNNQEFTYYLSSNQLVLKGRSLGFVAFGCYYNDYIYILENAITSPPGPYSHQVWTRLFFGFTGSKN